MDGEPTRADITAKVRQLLGQATLLRARGSRAEAIKLAQEALTLDQAHADTHELIGDLLVDLNRGGEAVASFRRARELNPSRVTLEDKLARAASAGRRAWRRPGTRRRCSRAHTSQPARFISPAMPRFSPPSSPGSGRSTTST